MKMIITAVLLCIAFIGCTAVIEAPRSMFKTSEEPVLVLVSPDGKFDYSDLEPRRLKDPAAFEQSVRDDPRFKGGKPFIRKEYVVENSAEKLIKIQIFRQMRDNAADPENLEHTSRIFVDHARGEDKKEQAEDAAEDKPKRKE